MRAGWVRSSRGSMRVVNARVFMGVDSIAQLVDAVNYVGRHPVRVLCARRAAARAGIHPHGYQARAGRALRRHRLSEGGGDFLLESEGGAPVLRFERSVAVLVSFP